MFGSRAIDFLATPQILQTNYGTNPLSVIMQMTAAFLDWSEDYTGPKYDLVLACDVLYEVRVLFMGAPASSKSLVIDLLPRN